VYNRQCNTTAVSEWVSATEEHWDNIEETDYQPLNIDGKTYDPFDTETINNKLADSGLLYSAGLGRLGQPHFVLAKQLARTTAEQCTCIECGEELARDIMTLPAMAQGKTVYIRHESLTHLVWQMVDEWSINKAPGPMARLVEHYNIKNDSDLEESIVNASRELSNVLKHHELGEIAAGELLGQDFQKMTADFHGKPGEMQIRAVRDLLADSLRTWPWIAKGQTEQSSVYLDFWLAGLIGYRENIFNMSNPNESLYSDDADQRLETLTGMIDTEQTRWQHVATELLSEHQVHGVDFDIDATIKRLIETAS